MAEILTGNIRNIAVIGQNSVGKTSLCDALIYDAKASSRLGNVEDGSSVFDHSEEEIKRQISIKMSLAQFEYNEKKINLIDTPGYIDFIGEPISALRAVDITIVCVDAVEGIPFNTIRLVNEATKDNLCKMFFVNRMDKENANYDTALGYIKDFVKTGVMPLTIPIIENNLVKGVIDLLQDKAYFSTGEKVEEKEIPEELKADADNYRTKMIEAVAETNDDLMEKYFDRGSLSEDELAAGLKEGIINGSITPVFSGVANGNVGIKSLLEFIIKSAPSPADRGAFKVPTGEDSEIEIKPDASAPVKAFVFKTETEPHVGELNFTRVYSGTIQYGEEYINTVKDVKEKIGQITNLMGKAKKEVKTIIAGDIGILLKLKNTGVSDTLCDSSDKMKFPAVEFPNPLIDMAIVAKTKADEDKLGESIHKLLDEDPTISIHVDSELKQTIVSGMGQIQIDILVANLKSRYNVEVEFEKTKIPYRETIKKTAQAQGKYKKQTGGRGQYGDCHLKIEPLPSGSDEDFEFVNAIVGGSIPGKYVPSVERGVKESLQKGLLAGFPAIKIRATVYDGSYHNVDSSDIAFQIAGSMALKACTEQARPILLEPVVKVKIYAPEKYMGDIMSDMNGRRGKIQGMEDQSGLKTIKATVPQAEMNMYINDLKSITQGSGTFESAFDHYDEVPPDISKKIVEASKQPTEEE